MKYQTYARNSDSVIRALMTASMMNSYVEDTVSDYGQTSGTTSRTRFALNDNIRRWVKLSELVWRLS
ncbi:MAG: hypothetical protein QXY52_01980 [Conexivisphaerales archaeon]